MTSGSVPPALGPAVGALPPLARPPPHVTVGRVVAGIFLAVLAFAFLAYVPYRIDLFLASSGLATPLRPETVLVLGTALAVFAGFRHIAKPTSLYGPALIGSAVVGLVYILLLLDHPFLSLSFGSFATFSLVYRTLLVVLAIAPGLRLLAGAVVTLEDLWRPGERARIQFG